MIRFRDRPLSHRVERVLTMLFIIWFGCVALALLPSLMLARRLIAGPRR